MRRLDEEERNALAAYERGLGINADMRRRLANLGMLKWTFHPGGFGYIGITDAGKRALNDPASQDCARRPDVDALRAGGKDGAK